MIGPSGICPLAVTTTGKPIRITGMTTARIVDGKIVEGWATGTGQGCLNRSEHTLLPTRFCWRRRLRLGMERQDAKSAGQVETLSRLLRRLQFRPSRPLRCCDLPPCGCRECPFPSYRNNLGRFNCFLPNLCPTRSLGGPDPGAGRGGQSSSAGFSNVCFAKSGQGGTDCVHFLSQAVLFFFQEKDDSGKI